MTLSAFPPQINGGLGRLGASAGAAAAADWWLAGGVNPADVAAVWQPIGAASLAASYLRIAGSLGNANIDPALAGGVAPTFDSATGWNFSGNVYLISGVTPAANWSILVRYSDETDSVGYLFGTRSPNYGVLPMYIGVGVGYVAGGSLVSTAPTLSSGVVGFAGSRCYRNGNDEGLTLTNGGTSKVVWIGAANNVSINNPSSSNIQAIATYSTTLTAPQVAAISAAAAALT